MKKYLTNCAAGTFLFPLLLSLSLLLLPSLGSCSEFPAAQEQTSTITVSMSDWNQLRSNLIEQENLLNDLSEELNLAKESLTTSEAETLELRMQLKEQQKLIETLRMQLEEQKEFATDALSSIAQANLLLKNMKDDIRKAKEEHIRTERRLERQRILWQIIAAGLGVAIATK